MEQNKQIPVWLVTILFMICGISHHQFFLPVENILYLEDFLRGAFPILTLAACLLDN